MTPADMDLAPPPDLVSTGTADQSPFEAEATLAELPAPSILRIKTAGDFAQGAALGFGYVQLASSSLLAAAPAESGPLLLEITLTRPEQAAALAEDHPDWFVHGATGPELRFLSDDDHTVDWWDQEITSFQRAGIAGFYARQAHLTPPAIWRRLITAAEERRPETLFIAEVFGATPEQAEGLADAGFSFATVSSCYWDFAGGWLNADAARSTRIAPAIALAGPFDLPGESPDSVRRALRFAASFSAGWIMEAGFAQGPGFDLADEVRALNTLRREHAALGLPETAKLRSSPGSNIALLARGNFITVVNASLDAPASIATAAFLPALGFSKLHPVGESSTPLTPSDSLTLAPGETRFYEAASAEPILLSPPKLDTSAPRIAIEAITPQVDDGRFPVRRIVGDLSARDRVIASLEVMPDESAPGASA